VNSTVASKNFVSLFFLFFEKQKIKITVQAQESTKWIVLATRGALRVI
jgi:hypothetical protein